MYAFPGKRFSDAPSNSLTAPACLPKQGDSRGRSMVDRNAATREMPRLGRHVFSVALDEQTLTIRALGILDFTAYDAFRACYEKAGVAAEYYVVDLGGVSSIDSSGLAMLLLLRDFAGGNHDRVTLANPNPILRRILVQANFDSLFRLV